MWRRRRELLAIAVLIVIPLSMLNGRFRGWDYVGGAVICVAAAAYLWIVRARRQAPSEEETL